MEKDGDLSLKTEKYFNCIQCLYRTIRKHNLKRHVVKMHTASNRKLECCGCTFLTKSILRDHLKAFHKNGHNCFICGRLFQRKALLARHLTVHSGQKEFRCSLCSYETSHKSNLERHKKVHRKKWTSFEGRKDNSGKAGGRYNVIKLVNSISLLTGQNPLPINERNVEGRTFLNSNYQVSNYKQTPRCTLYADSGHFTSSETGRGILAAPVASMTKYKSAFRRYMKDDNRFETEENLDPYVHWLIRSSHFRHVYCRMQDADASFLSSNVLKTEQFVNQENKIPRQRNLEIAREDENNEGERVCTDPRNPTWTKQPRLCNFPYKCNFCNTRFGTQHELSFHYDVCAC